MGRPSDFQPFSTLQPAKQHQRRPKPTHRGDIPRAICRGRRHELAYSLNRSQKGLQRETPRAAALSHKIAQHGKDASSDPVLERSPDLLDVYPDANQASNPHRAAVYPARQGRTRPIPEVLALLHLPGRSTPNLSLSVPRPRRPAPMIHLQRPAVAAGIDNPSINISTSRCAAMSGPAATGYGPR